MASFAVSLIGAGTETIGVVRCDQPRALDLRPRRAKSASSLTSRRAAGGWIPLDYRFVFVASDCLGTLKPAQVTVSVP
jgi:hypothetical protein